MAFKEYRNPCKKSATHEFDIERFAYDVFAYMLGILGFPEEKIPISSLKENIYIEDDFVRNVGLSALPISLYMRDEWRFTFEEIFDESRMYNIQEIQIYLESFIYLLTDAGELEEDDTLSKIQFSLALYNEYTLFLNSKGIGIYYDSLPKLWSRLCKELVEQSNFDQTLESSMTMCPDVSESWISNFIRNFAVPYGSSDDVSSRFSIHALKSHAENNAFEETSNEGTDVVPEEFIQSSDILDEYKVTLLPESSDSELNYVPGRWRSPVFSDEFQFPEDDDLIETSAHVGHKNGLIYVLHQCFKGRKRTRSQKLDVDDAFGRINLEKENISPEIQDSKRRRKISAKDTLE